MPFARAAEARRSAAREGWGGLAGLPITGEFATPQKVKTGDIPTTTFGKTGVKVSVIAQGGARWISIRIFRQRRRMSAGYMTLANDWEDA